MVTIDRPNATMEAAVFHGHQRITIERVKIPDVGAGEVLLRVSRTALCGSDFKLWHKGAEFTAGHEIFGVVEQSGHPMHGCRCAVYIPLHCDRCDACRRGDTQMCLEISSLIGWDRPGGYAEYLPVPENCLLPVPDDIEDSLAPLLLDTIGTSAHAVRFVSRVVRPREAGPVLVTGAGPVGLGVILALRDAGFSEIHVSDPNAERLKTAQAFGARVRPVGDATKRFALVLVGENTAPWTIEEGKVFRRKDFYMIRTFYFPIGDFIPNIHLLRRYRDEYRVLIDGEFALKQLPQNFARFAEGKLIKPVLALERE
jgi:threonine dehydrogenase-like Zn-dependent dehydrogenase